MNDAPWSAIFDKLRINDHNFNDGPFLLNAAQIKSATSHFGATTQREVRILCKQDSRESRPQVFVDRGVFLLPITNGEYALVKGEGYVDIPELETPVQTYISKISFKLDTPHIGNSEMQHLDFAYASSLVRTVLQDDTLVLTIRGRKYTPEFSFRVGSNNLTAHSVQTEVDAGYEGEKQLVLIEAKNSLTSNTIIRQLYYPFRQWSEHTSKKVKTLFFEKRGKHCSFYLFEFEDRFDYNSIRLTMGSRFEIVGK